MQHDRTPPRPAVGPFRMDVSWRDWYYEPGPGPVGAQPGDSVAMREDRLTDADIDRAKAAIDAATGRGALLDEELDFYARTALAAVFEEAQPPSVRVVP